MLFIPLLQLHAVSAHGMHKTLGVKAVVIAVLFFVYLPELWVHLRLANWRFSSKHRCLFLLKALVDVVIKFLQFLSSAILLNGLGALTDGVAAIHHLIGWIAQLSVYLR